MFSGQALYVKRIFIKSLLRVMAVVLGISAGWVISIDWQLYKQVNFCHNLNHLGERYQQAVILRLKETPLHIAQAQLQKQVDFQNHRTRVFIWLKQWCDFWFCKSAADSEVKQLTLNFDPNKQVMTPKWQMNFKHLSTASAFSNWLAQIHLLDKHSMISMDPSHGEWLVRYSGKEQL